MIRLGAIADIHAREGGERQLRDLFGRAQDACDVLVVAGDLTDSGLVSEAHTLASVFREFELPVAAVLGNHDFHHDHQIEIRQTLEESGMIILDGEGWTFERDGVRLGIAGCVGFGGGFRPYGAAPFGEPEWKYLHAKVVEESRKLDRGLSAVRDADYVIAVMHYSPTVDTMGDEPEALYPYLGSSELGDAVERYDVLFAVHGHAHRGRREGCTANGIPVFNVGMPIIEGPLVWEFEPRGESSKPTAAPEPIALGAPGTNGTDERGR